MLDFYKGMDLSFVPQCIEEGMQMKDFDGTVMEPLELAKKYGVNAVRLRIWNEPKNIPESGGYCDYAQTVAMAKKIREQGMEFMLDFHYSDWWADPGQQRKPKAWEELHEEALENAVYEYTKDVLLGMRAEGVMPDMVQIGNEIRSGLLFPDGEVPNYEGMVRLVNAGIRGARAAGGEELQIMIHLDQGGRYDYLKKWFDEAFAHGLEDFDVIGLSYYPFWHGTFADLKYTIEHLTYDYQKPIILAETAHAWRRSASGFIDEAQEKIAGFPATPKGQRQVLELVENICASLPEKRGRGIFYWEPFCVPREGGGGWEENMGVLTEDGTVMEAIQAFTFTREQATLSEIAKVYPPREMTVPVGTLPVLPEEVSVLYFDGTMEKRPISWQPIDEAEFLRAGQAVCMGTVEGFAEPVPVEVRAGSEEDLENVLQDVNFDDGFASWEVKKSGDEVSVSILPEFIDPFPAPPVNAVGVEAEKNFSFSISQKTPMLEAGTWTLSAEYMGTDTTNVNVRLFLAAGAEKAEAVIHPTEHEWQQVSVELELKQPMVLTAGLEITAPPVYGRLRRMCLCRKK